MLPTCVDYIMKRLGETPDASAFLLSPDLPHVRTRTDWLLLFNNKGKIRQKATIPESLLPSYAAISHNSNAVVCSLGSL